MSGSSVKRAVCVTRMGSFCLAEVAAGFAREAGDEIEGDLSSTRRVGGKTVRTHGKRKVS